jgi:hypothetical protein
MLHLWLSRSCNSPLTLSVNDYFENDAVCSCIEALIPHCRRWQDVKLTLLGSQFNIFSAVAGSLPLLEKLYINTLDTPLPTLGCIRGRAHTF